MIARSEAESCLERVRELGRSHRLIDCHVHPFEAMYGTLAYRRNPGARGVYSLGDTCYVPPETGGVEERPTTFPPKSDPKLLARMAMLGMRRIYSHTGPKCLGDQMVLCGFSRSLLLPVLQPGEGEEGIETMAHMFGGDDRFLLGYCVPSPIPGEEVASTLQQAVDRLGVRVVKIHPNVQRLDLRTAAGKERMEVILEAASRAGLPVVIHAGISPALDPPEAGFFSLLEALSHIDFTVTSTPVIVAHGGLLGHSASEARQTVLPRLETLLSRFGHLNADISGLRLDVLSLLLGRIGSGRLLFGSDALYEAPWQTAVKLIHSLRQSPGDADEEFVRIAAINPHRIFEKEAKAHVTAHAHQVSSVC